MNQNCMITREAALEFGLSFQNTYTERPFRDQNWQVVRVKENKIKVKGNSGGVRHWKKVCHGLF